MDNIKFSLIIIGCISLFVFLLYEANEDEKRFSAKMQAEYEKCIAAKETEYTCKSYIDSMRAERSADVAEMVATVAIVSSVANSGKR